MPNGKSCADFGNLTSAIGLTRRRQRQTAAPGDFDDACASSCFRRRLPRFDHWIRGNSPPGLGLECLKRESDLPLGGAWQMDRLNHFQRKLLFSSELAPLLLSLSARTSALTHRDLSERGQLVYFRSKSVTNPTKSGTPECEASTAIFTALVSSGLEYRRGPWYMLETWRPRHCFCFKPAGHRHSHLSTGG